MTKATREASTLTELVLDTIESEVTKVHEDEAELVPETTEVEVTKARGYGKQTKRSLPPYTCPSCGYITPQKNDMRKHLNSVSQCPKLVQDIEITDEIKAYLLQNRIYNCQKKEPAKQKKERNR